LFLGINSSTGGPDQWAFTQKLRPCTFNAKMMKGGQVLYQGTWYAGYIGVLTGVRQNAMTITVDSRFDNNYDKYLLDWFMDPTDNDQWLSLTTRQAMETYNNYPDALQYIANAPLIGPAYIIIGGSMNNQGAVVTKGPNSTLIDIWTIPEAYPTNATVKWYILETNYDHWNAPPWYDDRRYPAEKCMNEVGQNNISLVTMFNVLNGKPNLNRLTTYTALMDCKEGYLESYLQYCEEYDCVPW